MRKLNIRIVTNCYPPEIGAAANQLFELAQALTQKGHNLTVVTRFSRHLPKEVAPVNNGRSVISEVSSEAKILRVNVPQLSRRIPLLREFEHFLNFILLAWGIMLSGPADVTLVYSPPIVVTYAAWLARFFNKSRIVMNVQDLFPQSLIDLGAMKNPLLIHISRLLERYIYRKVDRITVMSEGNRRIVAKTCGAPDKVKVIYNWVDTEYIRPEERDNQFRRELSLGNKFVLSFAGCIADSQDMDIILESAKKLQSEPNLVFLIAGNGPRYADTIEKVKDLALNNVRIIPIQPREKYVKLLAASDVALVTLNPSVVTPVVPSKMLSIMSAGRPILASLPLSGDAPGFIERAGAGIVVAAGDQPAFYEAIMKLYKDPELRKKYGENGRKYVVENYSLPVCSKQYEDLFQEMVNNAR